LDEFFSEQTKQQQYNAQGIGHAGRGDKFKMTIREINLKMLSGLNWHRAETKMKNLR
jgi:hypothetical protein